MYKNNNGLEFISGKLKARCLANRIEHIFTPPGKSILDRYIEHFNGNFRRSSLTPTYSGIWMRYGS